MSEIIVYSKDPNFEPVTLNSDINYDHIKYYDVNSKDLTYQICRIIAKTLYKNRDEKIEKLILHRKDAYCAVHYAINVLQERWPEAEPIIVTSGTAWDIYDYTKRIFNRRWSEGESVILKNKRLAIRYAIYVIRGPWPELEHVIKSTPSYALKYCKDIKGRWPEAEKYILKRPMITYNYAKYVIKGPWPEAEPALARLSFPQLFLYIKWLKQRRPEYENEILKYPRYIIDYARYIIKGRWSEGEQALLNQDIYAPWQKSAYFKYLYAKYVIKKRWLEAEDDIIKSHAYLYSKYVIKGRWPEAEEYIQQRQNDWFSYQGFIEETKDVKHRKSRP